MDRRRFVVSSTLAAALGAATWMRGTSLLGAQAAIADGETGTDEIALHLIHAILPFEHPKFPNVKPGTIRALMYRTFALQQDLNFAGAMMLFNDIGAFLRPPAAVREQELAIYLPGATAPADRARVITQLTSSDKAMFEHAFSRTAGSTSRFSALALDNQRKYLGLWAASAFGFRRRFYRSVKALVNASAFSTDELWLAIGYEGPLLSRGVRS